jgi:hypothetical protein
MIVRIPIIQPTVLSGSPPYTPMKNVTVTIATASTMSGQPGCLASLVVIEPNDGMIMGGHGMLQDWNIAGTLLRCAPRRLDLDQMSV